jgi:predicted GNAT superfamily acetyltransferase
MPELRAATPGDIDAIVALNAAVVDVTSPMDAERCAALMALADPCIVAEEEGAVIGFALAMQSGAAYENANFAWFSARLRNFVYIDRIVIGAAGRGLGLGTRLYDAVIAHAPGRLMMAAEMDLNPPNTASLAFHKARGFLEIGQRSYDMGRVVSMQVRPLD